MRRMRKWRGTTAVAVLTLAATALGPAMLGQRTGIGQEGHDQGGRHQPDRGDRRREPRMSRRCTGTPFSAAGPTYHLKPGTYYISGDVPTPTSDPNVVNQTLVVRKVDVRKSGTITLDSRGGKLALGLAERQATEHGRRRLAQANACDPNGIGGTNTSLNGPVYVKPTRIAGLTFAWGWHSSPA